MAILLSFYWRFMIVSKFSKKKFLVTSRTTQDAAFAYSTFYACRIYILQNKKTGRFNFEGSGHLVRKSQVVTRNDYTI